MADSKSGSVASRFNVGDQVWVKVGVSDPNYPDLPLGGWTGTITEILKDEGQFNCVFRVDNRSMSSLDPIFRKRSEIDGLDYRFMGLGQEELELDDGVPVPIEQPTNIIPRPLSMDDDEDRIRCVFGLTHDDLVPEVRYKHHLTFYRYLLANLKFPFKAGYRPRQGGGSRSHKLIRLTVTGLYDFDQYEVEEAYGLIGVGKEPGGPAEFPLVEIEQIEDEANRRLIDAYSFWLANFQ